MGRYTGRRPHGKPKSRWNDNTALKDMRWEHFEWSNVMLDKVQEVLELQAPEHAGKLFTS